MRASKRQRPVLLPAVAFSSPCKRERLGVIHDSQPRACCPTPSQLLHLLEAPRLSQKAAVQFHEQVLCHVLLSMLLGKMCPVSAGLSGRWQEVKRAALRAKVSTLRKVVQLHHLKSWYRVCPSLCAIDCKHERCERATCAPCYRSTRACLAVDRHMTLCPR